MGKLFLRSGWIDNRIIVDKHLQEQAFFLFFCLFISCLALGGANAV